jgi:hypothetical protein
MAFNPNHYETIYGFSTLDELHNFMPEMLYDDAIFPNEIGAFMRHRVRTLFRDTYVRQQHLYMMYNASQRRQSFAEWRRGRMAPLRDAPPLPTTNNQASSSMVTEEEVNAAVNLLSSAVFPTNGAVGVGDFIARNTAGTSFRNVNRTNAPTTPANATTTAHNPPPIRRTRDSLQYVMETTIPAGLFQNTPGSLSLLLGGMLNELGGIGGGGGGGRNIWTDVDVRASAAEISAGSSIVAESALPADINCAICQEHTYAEGGNHQWRRLYCSHQFHIECIDPWLQQNVHCPVCRADIREPSANAGAGAPRRTYAAAAAAGSEPASTS